VLEVHLVFVALELSSAAAAAAAVVVVAAAALLGAVDL
jgi:hypothetical protein